MDAVGQALSALTALGLVLVDLSDQESKEDRLKITDLLKIIHNQLKGDWAKIVEQRLEGLDVIDDMMNDIYNVMHLNQFALMNANLMSAKQGAQAGREGMQEAAIFLDMVMLSLDICFPYKIDCVDASHHKIRAKHNQRTLSLMQQVIDHAKGVLTEIREARANVD